MVVLTGMRTTGALHLGHSVGALKLPGDGLNYSEVLRDPTLKSELSGQANATMGFVYYPVDQAADIYMVSPKPPQEGDEVLVPVGEDQEVRLEWARRLGLMQEGAPFSFC